MENDDNLLVKIMIVMLFLAGLLVGLAISSSKECQKHFNREDVFLTTYNSPIFIKNQTLASMSEDDVFLTTYNSPIFIKNQTLASMSGDIEIVLLAERIIQCESGWRADAKNPSSSAYGLGQVTDGTFNWFQEKYKIKLDRHNPKDQMYIVVKLLEDGGYNHWAESSNCWDKEHKYIKG